MYDFIFIEYNKRMELESLFFRFGVALGIGILIGLQREFAFDDLEDGVFAGVRTYTLFALSGCTAGLISEILGSPWPFIVIMLVFGILIGVAYFVSARKGELGTTSEVAAILTILLGALAYWEQFALATALAVAVTVLLALKQELERFARRITRDDLYATLKFAVITAIILPVLPNRPLGPPPLDVINPNKVWLMVVFISGISFLGYLLIKFVGPQQGIGLTGFLGGLVSSTAVTLSFSQRSQSENQLTRPFAMAIIIAWTVMFSRVFIEVAVLNLPLLKVVWLPLAAAGIVGLGYGAYLFFSQPPHDIGEVSFSNPFELGPAVAFGLLYAVVLLVSHAAQIYFGETGIFISSILAGTTDVDAITLSMAQLSGANGDIELITAARAIVLAAMSNTMVKGGIAISAGSPYLRKTLLPGFLLMLVAGIGVAFLM
jgi:uncharacterized membrane protein (DUF4010 family)